MKRTLISAALLVIAAGAFAQNLNPTVVVTNTYTQEASGIDKPALLLEVPDSVMKFNLDFDYAVQHTPYKGAYEFQPYLVQLRPMPRATHEGKLYLNGGVGYTAHPELDVVWTPVRTGKFHLNVFGSHRSYLGYYRNLGIQDFSVVPDGTRYSGASMHTNAGVDGVLGWGSGILTADLRYKHVLGADKIGQFSNHIGQLTARVKGNEDAPLAYEAGTRISALTGTAHPNAPYSVISELHSLSDLTVGTHFGAHYLKLGVGVETVSGGNEYAVDLAFIPRYVFSVLKFRFDLGVRLSYIFRSSESPYGANKRDWVFPEAHVSYSLFSDALVLQAAATGGDRLNVYTDMLESNPYLMGFLGQETLTNSTERFNLMIGARGHIAKKFSYDLKAGWSYWKDGLLYGFRPNLLLEENPGENPEAQQAPAWLPTIAYAPHYHQLYTDLTVGWKSQHIDIDGHLLYRYTTIDQPCAFAPPALSGQLKAMYIWGGRIRAGVTVSGITNRTTRMDEAQDAPLLTLPGWVDLGLLGDLQMTEKLGLWVKMGNLLNQTVSPVPFHAENGIWFSVGARLNF